MRLFERWRAIDVSCIEIAPENNFLKAKTTLMAFDLKASAQVTEPLELFDGASDHHHGHTRSQRTHELVAHGACRLRHFVDAEHRALGRLPPQRDGAAHTRFGK